MLFLLPLFGTLFLMLSPTFFKLNKKWIAVFFSLSPLLILFFKQQEVLSHEIRMLWFQPLSIYFYLKVDFISFLFMLVTIIVTTSALLSIKSESILHFSLILILEAILLLFFMAKDLALFTLLFEASLLPMFFILLLFGDKEKSKIALQFILYMVAGSCLMILASLSLYFAAEKTLGVATFDMDLLKKISEQVPESYWIFIIFLVAFLVKTPIFPIHAWLPDVYTEASTSGSILLAGILSKLGIYGLFRIGEGFFPHHMQDVSKMVILLAIFTVLYAGVAAWMQKDSKRLIAYSSFSHVNFILVGVFLQNEIGKEGALLQVFNHGVTITGLFLVASFLEERIHTRTLTNHLGLVESLPRLCWLTLLFVLSSIALPSTGNFIGELLIFFALFDKSPILVPLLGLSIILSVIYMLRYMELNFFGHDVKSKHLLNDLNWKEVSLLIPLLFLIFFVGIYPELLLKQMELSR